MTIPPAVQAASTLNRAWVEVTACPICEGRESRPFESIEMGAEHVSYRLCSNCGSVYQSPRMSDEALENYYVSDYLSQHQRVEGISEKELRVQAGRARHLIRVLGGQVRTVRRHLDVGSSTGKLMQAVVSAYGCVSVGVEPAQAYRSYCAANGLKVYPQLQTMSESDEQRFDLITLAHVLEHLPDPVEFLRDLQKRWLVPEGTLLVEVPNLFGHLSLERPHLLCFNSATLHRALTAGGFELRRIVSHGSPRSRLIPLYLTAIAGPAGGRAIERSRSSARGVRLRRRLGMGWHRLASQLLTRWAWLPLPEQ